MIILYHSGEELLKYIVQTNEHIDDFQELRKRREIEFYKVLMDDGRDCSLLDEFAESMKLSSINVMFNADSPRIEPMQGCPKIKVVVTMDVKYALAHGIPGVFDYISIKITGTVASRGAMRISRYFKESAGKETTLNFHTVILDRFVDMSICGDKNITVRNWVINKIPKIWNKGAYNIDKLIISKDVMMHAGLLSNIKSLRCLKIHYCHTVSFVLPVDLDIKKIIILTQISEIKQHMCVDLRDIGKNKNIKELVIRDEDPNNDANQTISIKLSEPKSLMSIVSDFEISNLSEYNHDIERNLRIARGYRK